MRPKLLTPSVEKGVSIEEALTRIVGSMGDQSDQISIKLNELGREVHVERENLRDKKNGRQE